MSGSDDADDADALMLMMMRATLMIVIWHMIVSFHDRDPVKKAKDHASSSPDIGIIFYVNWIGTLCHALGGAAAHHTHFICSRSHFWIKIAGVPTGMGFELHESLMFSFFLQMSPEKKQTYLRINALKVFRP